MSSRHHKSLVFEVTNACNHNCLHCYNGREAREKGSGDRLDTKQTLALLKNVIDDTGVSLISLSGGEPLLRPDIFEIIDFLNDRDITVNLITNGSMLDEAAIRRLTPDKISIFELPLLSGSAKIHDLLSGATGAFDKVTLAIARLKAALQTVVTPFVATKINLSELAGTIELAVAMGVDGLMFNRFNPGGLGFENIDRLLPSPDEIAGALDIANRMSGEYELPISCSIPLPPCLIDTSKYPNLNTGYCALGTDNAYFTIDPSGKLRPCNHSPTVLGDLTKRGFWDLADSERMNQYLITLPKECEDCQHLSECKGCCRAAAESCFGSARELDPFVRQF